MLKVTLMIYNNGQDILATFIFVGSSSNSQVPLLGMLKRDGPISDVTSSFLNYLIQVIYRSSLKLRWIHQQQGLERVSPAVQK